jgi:hypothetical protein
MVSPGFSLSIEFTLCSRRTGSFEDLHRNWALPGDVRRAGRILPVFLARAKANSATRYIGLRSRPRGAGNVICLGCVLDGPIPVCRRTRAGFGEVRMAVGHVGQTPLGCSFLPSRTGAYLCLFHPHGTREVASTSDSSRAARNLWGWRYLAANEDTDVCSRRPLLPDGLFVVALRSIPPNLVIKHYAA